MHLSSEPSSPGHSLEVKVVPSWLAHQSVASPPMNQTGASPASPDQASMRNSNRIEHADDEQTRRTANTLIHSVHTCFQHSYTAFNFRHSLIQSFATGEPLSVRAILGDSITAEIIYRDDSTNFDSIDLSSAISATARPLTKPIWTRVDAYLSDMTTTTSAPGSPPDLSGSRSSKSSSYCSTSQFSNHDGILSDISNFEEIGLDDERPMPNKSAQSNDQTESQGNKPAGPQSSLTKNPTSTNLIKPAAPFPAAKKSNYPSLRGQVRDAVNKQQYRPQINGSEQRGCTSPSVPVLPAALREGHPRTRSISPVHRTSSSLASTAKSASTIRLGPFSSRSSLPLPARTPSWHPNRKSVQELEAEYHDSDDELPDEANLWNVPMSPRLPDERISPNSSSRGSPDGRRGSRSPRPIPLAHAKTAPDSPPAKAPNSRPLPRNRILPPRSSSLQSATFADTSPTSPRSRTSLRASRTKSWTMAMSDLSEEAKILSEALEYHAEHAEREREDRVQAGRRSSRPSLENRSNRSSRSIIQLPPVQKGNLDFLPISKEKEAMLSRTRPSWLPPKDPKEEKRHLKEYQQMMAASIEAEKKKEGKLNLQKCQKDDTREALNKVWELYVSPDQDTLDSDDRIRDLWWRGVSSKVRGQVWERAIGNQLALSSTTYNKALSRAKDIQKRDFHDLGEMEKCMLEWFRDIERDAETAFPELNLFQRSGPLWQDLVDVCEAYSCYRSDIGYVYGVQLISALLLLQLHTPAEVFVLLANFLNRPIAYSFLANDLGATSRTYGLAISTLAIKFPRLHFYLFGSVEKGGLGMSGEAVFEPMFRTLFSNGLDADRLSRVWDCWVFEGDRTLVRTAVAVLGALQSQIYDVSGPIDLMRRNVQEMLGWGPFGRRGGYWDMSAVGNVEAFMDEVRDAGKLDYTGR